MLSRRRLLTALAATGAVGTAAACSPSSSNGGGDDGEDAKTLTFRLWDETAKPAYEESFQAFTEKTGWKVAITVVPWDEYWKTLSLDVGSSEAADVYWMNSANFVQFQESGNLMNINDVVTEGQDKWVKSVVDLYTRGGGLWGVPQLWDSIALFYNKSLTDAAGIDPASLRFDPAAPTDTLRDAGRALTLDQGGKHPGDEGFDPNARTQFAFNAQADRQAIIGPFLASNGAQWQDADEKYSFASAEGIAAFQYAADLVNVQQIAPSAADTNENGDFTRDLFTQGKLALFQSGPYNVKNIAEGVGDTFAWGIAPLVAGPAGGKSVIHGVVAVGNARAEDEKKEGIQELLRWLGTADGQRPLGTQGVAFPAHADAQGAFVEHWSGKGVDVQQFITATNDTTPADRGAKSNAGLEAAMPTFQEIFIGRQSAADGLPAAQEAGNEAMA